jgi:hypothetical protein
MNTRRVVFMRRRIKDRVIEYAYFYESNVFSSTFSARFSRSLTADFFNYIGFNGSWSRSGKTLFIPDGSEIVFRLLALLASINHCSRKPLHSIVIFKVLSEMGEYSSLYWYNELLKRYEMYGRRGMYRVAKAFKILNGI